MKLFLLLFLLWSYTSSTAQSTNKKVYYSISEALADPSKAQSLYLNTPSSIDSLLWDSLPLLVHLKSLSLGFDRQLKKLPSSIFQLSNLEELCLYGASLDTLPKAIQQLKKLQKITIKNASIAYYPASINKLKHLVYLELHNLYKTEALPESIGQLKKLKELKIYESPIHELPPSMVQLKQLEVLILTRNKLTTFPAVINQLKSLKELTLEANKLVEMPVFSTKLQQLESINLRFNAISNFSSSLLQLPALKHLDIAGNPIQFPSSLPSSSSSIQFINANYCQLETFPIALANLEQLEELQLKRNKISKLSKAILPFKQLKKLDLSRSTIEVIEEGVYFGDSLQELNLMLNTIKELPSSVISSPPLQKVNVSFCYLTAIPQGLEQLDSLQLADFKYNQLQTIPMALKKELGTKLNTLGNPFTLSRDNKKKAIAATRATVIDPRDGQSYATVNIDGKTWMAEHLNYKTTTSIPDTLLPENGRLYLLQEYDKVCPAGWHTATTQDWRHLVEVVYQYFELDPNARVNQRIASTRKPYGESFEDPFIVFDPNDIYLTDFGKIGAYFVKEDFTRGVSQTPHANFLGLNIAARSRRPPVYNTISFPTLNQQGQWELLYLQCVASTNKVELLGNYRPQILRYYPLRCVQD